MTDRVAFELFGMPVYWYGVFAALGFLAGMMVMQWRGRKLGIKGDDIGHLVFIAFLAGIAGARLWYVATNWSDFADKPLAIFAVRQGGLVFYGGFLGGALGVCIAARLRGLDLRRVADMVAPALPIGQVFGRIGCFLNGCCFGCPTDGPLGVHYWANPKTHEGHVEVLYVQQELGQLTAERWAELPRLEDGMVQCLPVVPVQLFNVAAQVLIFVILIVAARHLKYRGQLFALFLMLYAVARFSTEFFRGDYLHHVAGLTQAQLVCLGLLPVGAAIFVWMKHLSPEAQKTANE